MIRGQVKKAGDIVQETLRALLGEDYERSCEYSKLFKTWPDTVAEVLGSQTGAALAAASRVKDHKDACLFIETTHPGWIQILKTAEKPMIALLNRRFPRIQITSISVKLKNHPNIAA